MKVISNQSKLGRGGRYRLFHASVPVLTIMMAASPAFAQQAASSAPQPQDGSKAEPATSEPDIIVTAQFRSQRLQDTPIAITAMSGADLEARAQTSVTDIGSFAPNVNIAPAYSSFGSSINAFIRGVGQNDSNFALEPGVGLYIDDIYYGATFGAVFDLSDLERVEVLRGPQGTLSGKNSLGGAIKLFSKKPQGDGSGYIEGTYGRFNRIDVRGGFDLKLANDLFMRVSAVSKQRDGFLTRLDFGCANPGRGVAASPTSGRGCKIGTEGGQSLNAARVALRYAPGESPLEINVIADVTRDKSEPTAAKLLFAGNPGVRSYVQGNPAAGVPFDSRFLTGATSYTSYASYTNGGNYTTVFGTPYQELPGTYVLPVENSVLSWGVAGTIDYALSDALSIKSITAYRDADGYSTADLDGSPLNLGMQGNSFGHQQFTQELRLSGKVNTFADFTIGGFYYKSHDYIRQRVNFPTVMLDFLTDDPIESRSVSAFGHLELHPTENLNIVGGVRYTNDRKSYEFSRANPDGSPVVPGFLTPNFTIFGLDGLSNTFKGDRFDYRLGANYRFSDALMVYGQVSTGFKGGGVNPRPYNAAQLRTFGPETLTTYEVGFKGDFLDRKARVNGAVFFNKYKDIQLSLQACPDVPCSLPANAGDADVKGAELEVTLRPVAGLSINGSVGYLDFQYKRVDAASGVQLGFVAPFVSRWQASGGIDYVADLGDGGRLTPRLDWSYQSDFFFNPNNAPGSKVDARSIFNARLTYETSDRDWSASVGITNLFDKFYYVAKNENVVGFGVNQGVLGRPREWSLTIKRSF